MRTKGEGAKAATRAIRSYRNQIAEIERELQAIKANRAAIKKRLSSTRRRLAEGLLPEATAERLEQVTAALRQAGIPLDIAGRRRELEEQRQGWTARLAQIEAAPDFVERQPLLDPVDGTLVQERKRLSSELEKVRATLIRFDIEPIRWIEGRKTLQAVDHGGFSDFWRTVTFENYRIERAKKQACVKLEFESFEQLQAAMGQAIEGVNHWTGQLEALGQRRDLLIALIEEHGSLHGWVHFFEGNLLETLRGELITALAGSDLARLRKVLGTHPVGRLLSQVQGLQAKLAYLDDMITYLTKEHNDRRKRIASIDRTRKIWALKPYDSLTGDKTKWLVTVPEMKKKGLGKRLRWVRRIHRNVYEYDHWDDFDLYLLAADDFIPYDAFGYGADDPMPWEGFAREVIPDLDAFREQHDMEKKDYSVFKELGQQAQQGPSEKPGEDGDEGGESGGEGGSAGEAAAAGAAAAVVAAELMDETAEVADQS